MANPKAYLPPSLLESTIHSLLNSISFPIPKSVTLLPSSAAYHTIYILSYPSLAFLKHHIKWKLSSSVSSQTEIILRIAGNHFPLIKTQNECAVLKWLARNTSIPVPSIFHYDATSSNPIGHEYMLMSKLSGQPFSSMRASVSASEYEPHLSALVEQVADIVAELASHTWSHFGGLQETPEEGIIPGPIIDENMWQAPELHLFWSPSIINPDYQTDKPITQSDLNITGPFPTYTSLCLAQASKYIFAICTHPSLSPIRDFLPQIQTFTAAMSHHAAELDQTAPILSHRDLHMGNIMYDPSTRRITGILDWEFSAIVPAPRWDPQRAFMWDAEGGDGRAALAERVMRRCAEKGSPFEAMTRYATERQENMQLAMNYLRAIVEVLPRGEGDVKPWQDWRGRMLVCMEAVGAD